MIHFPPAEAFTRVELAMVNSEHGVRRWRCCGARGTVAFLLFLLLKPSVEAEQRQQVDPRAPFPAAPRSEPLGPLRVAGVLRSLSKSGRRLRRMQETR